MTDWTLKKLFKRYLECDYPESYDADGYILEIPYTTAGETWWAKIIGYIASAGKECCVLTDCGLTESILELGIETSEWKPTQLPKYVEVVKYLTNKKVKSIIFDLVTITKNNGKPFTGTWIQTYLHYLFAAIKDVFPDLEISLLVRESVYSTIEENGGRDNLLAVMNKWGISIIDACDVTDETVFSAPYYGPDMSKVEFIFYDFSGDHWSILKNEEKETVTDETETETTETETETEGETETETTETESTGLIALLIKLLKKLIELLGG